MILDCLENAARYGALGSDFARAFEFLKTLDPTLPDGRHEIEGEAVYANVMTYESKVSVDATHEVHRTYADVQFLINGQERMLFTPPERLGAGNGYHEAKDYELCDAPVQPSTLLVRAGQFAIFFPGEGHKPNLAIDTPAPVKKVVVKVRL